MSKQDRQGVRTPSDIERKYDFGGFSEQGGKIKEQNMLYSQLAQTLSQFMTETRSALNNLQEQITEIGGRREIAFASLNLANEVDKTYDELYSLWETHHIILRRTMGDNSVKEYHCMGTYNNGDLRGLIFQYSYGDSKESVFVGADNSVIVE